MGDSILITGAGGFIGRQLVRTLAQRGERVIAASRSPAEFDATNVEPIEGMLREPEDFAPWVARSRVVVYLASTSTPGTSAGHPIEDVTGNLLPLTALLQTMQNHPGVDLLYLSSGGALYAPNDGEATSERMPVCPRSYHGAGKIAAEYFISAWCNQYLGRATIVRPSNVYGPGQLERTGFGIVPTAMGKIRRNEVLRVWGDGSAIRDYLYIDDLIRLVAAILARPVPPGARVVNACSGVGTSLKDLFEALREVTGATLLCRYETGRSVDASSIVMDPSFALQEFGFSATTPLREGLKQTWIWLNSIMR